MYTFDDIVEEIKFQLRYRVPSEIATAQAERSLRDFCTKTGNLRTDFSGPHVDGEITITSDLGVAFGIKEIMIDDSLYRGKFTFDPIKSVLTLSNPSVKSDAVISCKVLIDPFVFDETLPRNFISLFGETIAYHACFKLSTNDGEPWAQPKRAAEYAAEYRAGVKRSLTKMNKIWRMK